LYILNIGGSHRPSKKLYERQEKMLEKLFCLKTKYEFINNNNIIFINKKISFNYSFSVKFISNYYKNILNYIFF